MYKSVIDLVPPGLNIAFFLQICGKVDKTKGTIARSLDDALGMVAGGAAGSHIRVWNFNFFSEGDQTRLREEDVELQFFNVRGEVPYAVEVTNELATGGIYKRRLTSEISVLTVHHTIGWNYNITNLENVKNIASYHANTQKWPGIGYHFLVCPDGEIFQTNDLVSVSYHAGSYAAPGDENWSAVGIAFAGDFRESKPELAQLSSGAALIAVLRNMLPGHCSVIPHKRMPGANTICPGYDIDPWMRVLNYGL